MKIMSSKDVKTPSFKSKRGKKHTPSPQVKRLPEPSPGQRGKGMKPGKDVKPVAKIPSSREDASSNWKALLQQQGKTLPAVQPPAKNTAAQQGIDDSGDVKRFRNSSPKGAKGISTDRDRSRSVSQLRSSSQLSMMSETASSISTDNFETESEAGSSAAAPNDPSKVKQEFRALGLAGPKPKVPERHSRALERYPKSPARAMKKLPPGGLNEFGFFDYNHYGVLRTTITPAHHDFMIDTGIIAMDCEMVGVGPMKESALGRVSIVNEFGYCIYDRFVKPKLEVTDYRTPFSGIRENDLRNAIPFDIVSRDVADILKGHILVGHSLKSDLSVLYLSHPKAKTRDTAAYFKKVLHTKTPKLKTLVKKLLGIDIQQGEHSSITDAQATVALYRLCQKEWEISVRQSNRGINILKEVLDEFRERHSQSGATFQNPLPVTPHVGGPHNSNNWYGVPDVHDVVHLSFGEPASVMSMPFNNVPARDEFIPTMNIPMNPPFYNEPLPMPPPPLPPFLPFCGFNGFPPLPPPPIPFHCPSNTPMMFPSFPPQFMEPPVLIPVYSMPSWIPMEFSHV